MDGKGRQWAFVRAATVFISLTALFLPGRTREVNAVSATTTVMVGTPATAMAHRALTQRALHLIGWPRSLHYGFLAMWPTDRLNRMVKWMELGFHIDGPWQSDELALVLEILDAFGSTYGGSRFAEIVRASVLAGSGGRRQDVWLVRSSGKGISVAAWYPSMGQMRICDDLFDDKVLAARYHWDFLTGPDVHADNEIDLRHVILGHEFGHIVIHGLQAEADAAGYHRTSAEGIYSRFVNPAQRPHGYGGTRESLATEVAVWALGIDRTPEVESFRSAFLDSTIDSALWPESTASLFAQASARAGR